MIRNPILPGFNPDPSILRVRDDYYIAASTFQWFPGVQIHHSRDLVHWRLLTRPLDRLSQLNMIGNPDSGGVWAPCLSYSDGLFYLVYTDVKSHAGAYKDTHNYVVTALDIMGPWSDPVYLNSSGFDPSLFHDDDGRKWVVNMQWDFRKDRNMFNGIYHEYTDREVPVAAGRPIRLKLSLDHAELQFAYRAEGSEWQSIGPVLDASKISDEYATHLVDGYFTDWGFTGAFIGLCAHDLSGGRLHADFDDFIYRERE